MNIERTTGVILRVRPLTDTSLIIHWLTPDLGRLATVAKGARQAKSAFRGQLDLFYEADFSFARSRRSELHTLREVKVTDPHAGLRRDLDLLRQASYAAALIEKATETETPLPAVYTEFRDLLNELTGRPARAETVFAFEMKILAESGLRPNLLDSALTPGAREALGRMEGLDWPGVRQLRLSEAQTGEIRRFLHGFLIYHLGKIPRGRPV